MTQTERNFWLDISLFLNMLSIAFSGFLLWLLIPHQTAAGFLGISRQDWLVVHIFSGFTGVGGNVLHIIWHRGWLKAMRRRPMASLPAKLRANRITDRFVWMVFLAAAVFAILGWIFPGVENRASLFGRLHLVFSIAWLVGITMHLIFHKNWIISASRHHFNLRRAGRPTTRPDDSKKITIPIH